jgi:ABC-type Fe3+/spermidine/putrescine transport system ATPase subunit
VRPENLELVTDDSGLKGTVQNASYLGPVARYQLSVEGQSDDVILDQHAPLGHGLLQPGDTVRFNLTPARGYIQTG